MRATQIPVNLRWRKTFGPVERSSKRVLRRQQQAWLRQALVGSWRASADLQARVQPRSPPGTGAALSLLAPKKPELVLIDNLLRPPLPDRLHPPDQGLAGFSLPLRKISSRSKTSVPLTN